MASEKITALIEEVKNLSVLELSELVKALEEEFGIGEMEEEDLSGISTVSDLVRYVSDKLED